MILCALVSVTFYAQPSARREAINHILEGDNFLRMGNWEYALNSYNNAVLSDSQYGDAYMKRALVHEKLGRSKESQHDYNMAIGLNPYSIFIFDKRNIGGLLSSDYKGQLSDEQTMGFEMERKVDDFISSGYYEAALTGLDSLLEIGFNPLLDMERKAIVLFLTGDLQGTRTALDSMQLQAGDSYIGKELLGLILLKENKIGEAIDVFTEAIRIQPNNQVAYFNRSLAYRLNGQTAEAAADMNKAIKIGLNSAEAFFFRALLKKDTGDISGALEDYDKAIVANPAFADAIYNRAYTLKLLGDYSSALDNANEVIDLDPETAEHWNLKGNIHFMFGEYREAIECYSQAVAIRSDYAEAYYNRGITHLMLFVPIKGCEDLERSKQLGYPAAVKKSEAFCGY
jgi:tetratricopeptide (TPR) repeat protein